MSIRHKGVEMTQAQLDYMAERQRVIRIHQLIENSVHAALLITLGITVGLFIGMHI